jgi:hypothetical protein
MKEPDDRLELLQGTLEMMILRTLLLAPSSGYQIAKTIEQMSDEVLQIDHGSLYPALYRLEKRGWLAAKWKVSDTIVLLMVAVAASWAPTRRASRVDLGVLREE